MVKARLPSAAVVFADDALPEFAVRLVVLGGDVHAVDRHVVVRLGRHPGPRVEIAQVFEAQLDLAFAADQFAHPGLVADGVGIDLLDVGNAGAFADHVQVECDVRVRRIVLVKRLDVVEQDLRIAEYGEIQVAIVAGGGVDRRVGELMRQITRRRIVVRFSRTRIAVEIELDVGCFLVGSVPGHAAPEHVDVEARFAVLVHFERLQFVAVDRVLELRESAFAVTCVGVDDRPRLVAVGVARDGVAAVGHGERVDLFLGYAVAAVGRSADTRGRGDYTPLVAAGDARVDLLRSAGPGTYRREERVEAGVGVRAVGADQRVEVQVHNVFGGLGCQLPFLFVVLGREQVVAVSVDDTLVEFVAVEELAGRVEQQAGAGGQGGAFRGTAVVDVGPAVGQPFGGFPELVRDVVDALVPGVALALVESALREVHRIVADEEDGTVDGQHHGVEMRAQEAGLVVVVALVDIVQFLRRALVDVLHEVVGFADALIGRVVGVVAVDG